MKTTALKVIFAILIVLNIQLSSKGDNTQDDTRKIRSVESFLLRRLNEIQNIPDYQALGTLAKNIKEYLGFPLAVLKKTGEDITDEISQILQDTFGDIDEDNMNNFISTTTSANKFKTFKQ